MKIFYISKKSALKLGLTHEGMLYGVPAWFAAGPEPNEAVSTPKIPVLLIWCALAEIYYAIVAALHPGVPVIWPIFIFGKINTFPEASGKKNRG